MHEEHRETCPPPGDCAAAADARAPRQWLEAQAAHIDVRGLPPPQPLVAILRLLQRVEPETPVVVHHDRDPVLLYPELSEIGWSACHLDAPPGEVRLLLHRVP